MKGAFSYDFQWCATSEVPPWMVWKDTITYVMCSSEVEPPNLTESGSRDSKIFPSNWVKVMFGKIPYSLMRQW